MFEAGSWLWWWLADQPPFIEVGIGMGFVLVLAPIVLAIVALLFTRMEAFVESIVTSRITVSGSEWNKGQADDEIASATATIPEASR